MGQQKVQSAHTGNEDANTSVVKPWKEAGVTASDWRRAHLAVVRLVADLVWRARGSRSTRTLEREAAMQRLSRIAEGDPEATRYGLDLAHSEDAHHEAQEPPVRS